MVSQRSRTKEATTSEQVANRKSMGGSRGESVDRTLSGRAKNSASSRRELLD